MEEIKFAYFTVEGAAADAVITSAKELRQGVSDRMSALLTKYAADCLWGGRRSAPHAIGFIFEREDFRAKPPMKEHFLRPEVERSGDVLYACYKPDQRYKAGKAIKAELKAVGSFDFSTHAAKALGVDRMVFGVLDGRQVMCQTSGGYRGGMLVFRIPVGGDHGETFTAPEGFREIKKSEFIAITEESGE